ncbi:MAG: hypothetical protein ACRYGP_33165 [Janthinobacterium lividum]
MTDQHALADGSIGTKLPMWLQCVVALIGTALLAGPAAVVVWYR